MCDLIMSLAVIGGGGGGWPDYVTSRRQWFTGIRGELKRVTESESLKQWPACDRQRLGLCSPETPDWGLCQRRVDAATSSRERRCPGIDPALGIRADLQMLGPIPLSSYGRRRHGDRGCRLSCSPVCRDFPGTCFFQRISLSGISRHDVHISAPSTSQSTSRPTDQQKCFGACFQPFAAELFFYPVYSRTRLYSSFNFY